MIFILPDVKNRVSVKNNGKISVTWMFLDPIKNRVSVKSVYVEAVYLKALLYINPFCDNGKPLYKNWNQSCYWPERN